VQQAFEELLVILGMLLEKEKFDQALGTMSRNTSKGRKATPRSIFYKYSIKLA
jgi:hypothetical protein